MNRQIDPNDPEDCWSSYRTRHQEPIPPPSPEQMAAAMLRIEQLRLRHLRRKHKPATEQA